MTNDKSAYLRKRFHKSRIIDAAVDFFHLEAAGGILLVLASLLALIVANSPLDYFYNHFFNEAGFKIGFSGFGDGLVVEKTMLHWVNDGLMAIFFLLVGLEIKREMVTGELSSLKKAMFPVFAAFGGMLVPALIYIGVNQTHPEALAGWAIPCATDIAFALAIMALLGDRVPLSLKVLLTAIAIIDDLGAIAIIAMFYSDDLHIYALLFSILPITGLLVLNRMGIANRAPYIILGSILWLAVLKSGVHATMAGVVTAMFIPVRVKEDARSPALRLEHDLHPWVIFLILPLFGFANAGVSFDGMGWGSLLEPVTLGIILGLFLGKQIGVFGASWLAVKSGLFPKPEGTHWHQIYGVSLLCGIGFTMSLFIGGLAFPGGEVQAEVRLGVLGGSFLSAIAAYFVLKSSGART